MKAGLEGQDVVVAVALAAGGPGSQFLADLLSPQARTASLKRLRACALIGQDDDVHRLALMELILHGARFVFPGNIGETLVLGMPTSLSGPALRPSFVINSGAEVVWPYRGGTLRGHALKPLHEDLPRVAPQYPSLYSLLTLVDAVRAGRSRERSLAADRLQAELG